MLTVLERLPSLDPFLLKTAIERLNASNPHVDIDVDEGYFEISTGDYGKIRSFVTNEFIPLAEAAFGESKRTPERAQQIANKMWDGTDASFLQPICALLNIQDAAVSDIMFSWKGVLYYKFIALGIESRTMDMLKGMRAMITSGHLTMQEKNFVDESRNELIVSFINMTKTIKSQINTYNNIYKNEF